MEYTEKLKTYFDSKYKPMIDDFIKNEIPVECYVKMPFLAEDYWVYRMCEIFYPEYDFAYGHEAWMIMIKKEPNGHPQHFKKIDINKLRYNLK